VDEYIRRMEDDERFLRYLSKADAEYFARFLELTKRYDTTLDGVNHMAFVITSDELHPHLLGVSHLYREEGDRFEVSYSRDPWVSGLGIGDLLMEADIRWAEQNGVTSLVACTHPDNLPMHALFRRYGFYRYRDPDDATLLHFRRDVQRKIAA
jgi:RimJ/RimL family protein N-acetyltransferase